MHTCAIYDMWSTRRVSYSWSFLLLRRFLDPNKTVIRQTVPKLKSYIHLFPGKVPGNFKKRKKWKWNHVFASFSFNMHSEPMFSCIWMFLKRLDWSIISKTRPSHTVTAGGPMSVCTVRRLWVWIHCQLPLSMWSLHVVLMPVWVMSGYLVILKWLGVSVSDSPSLCWPRPSHRDNLQSRIILLSKFISEQKTLYKGDRKNATTRM